MTLRRISVTSAGLTTSVTAYTSGDVVGTEFTFANVVGAIAIADGSGQIIGASITDEGNQLAACELVLFKTASTPAADNAAATWSAANIRNYVGVIKFATADMNVAATNRYGTIVLTGLGIPFTSTGSLFGTLVTRSANSFFVAVTDITISLMINS